MLKGNNTIKLLVVLLILVGVYLVFKFTGNKDRSRSFRSELVEIDAEEVTKVEIFSPADTTVLELRDGAWRVNDRKPANENAVKSMLNTLKSIKPSRIASRSEEAWAEYQVDDQGTRVVAYEGPRKALDIVLGRFNVEGQRSFYSYVRLADEPDTYMAREFMKMSIGTGDVDYRDANILNVQKDSLERIAFNYPDSAFVLTRATAGWQLDGAPADSASTAKYLNGLRVVTSRKFEEDPGLPALYEVTYSLKSGATQQVTAYEGGGLSASANPEEYWRDASVAAKIFKGRTYFQE